MTKHLVALATYETRHAATADARPARSRRRRWRDGVDRARNRPETKQAAAAPRRAGAPRRSTHLRLDPDAPRRSPATGERHDLWDERTHLVLRGADPGSTEGVV